MAADNPQNFPELCLRYTPGIAQRGNRCLEVPREKGDSEARQDLFRWLRGT
jgi:hypothetical protein